MCIPRGDRGIFSPFLPAIAYLGEMTVDKMEEELETAVLVYMHIICIYIYIDFLYRLIYKSACLVIYIYSYMFT